MVELGREELANGELVKATNAGSLCTVGKATDENANCLGCSPVLRPKGLSRVLGSGTQRWRWTA
jgi:hypothetical protein